MMQLPSIYLIKQTFGGDAIVDIPSAVSSELEKLELSSRIRPGETVAVATGSRGIRGIDRIMRSVIDALKELGARPFIVPAMGSHGGGTAERQREVLAQYGITESSMGCDIRSSLDVTVVGSTDLDIDVVMDAHAAEADHIAVVNRIKPHTKLSGEIESGLLKMCLIGLGNQRGAQMYHRAFEKRSWMEILRTVVPVLLERSSLAFGVAIVQNASEGIGKLVALRPEDFLVAEPQLLREAREMMATLPLQDIDLLIVDEMGKEISGTGMDTNITGRKEGSEMRVTRVFVRDLTEKTRGNAQGIGLADFTTRRLVDKIDFRELYLNSQTAYRTDTCKVPMTHDTDDEVLRVALDMDAAGPEDYRLVWIRNTLDLERIAVSKRCLEELRGREGVEVLKGPLSIAFDDEGNLVSPFS